MPFAIFEQGGFTWTARYRYSPLSYKYKPQQTVGEGVALWLHQSSPPYDPTLDRLSVQPHAARRTSLGVWKKPQTHTCPQSKKSPYPEPPLCRRAHIGLHPEVPSEGVQIGEGRCTLSGDSLTHRAEPRSERGGHRHGAAHHTRPCRVKPNMGAPGDGPARPDARVASRSARRRGGRVAGPPQIGASEAWVGNPVRPLPLC